MYKQPQTSWFAEHRFVLIAIAIFLVALAFGAWAPIWRRLAMYTATVVGVVWAAMGIHAALGPDTPFLVIGWMPYRLLNMLLPVWMATVVGVAYIAMNRVH